MYCKLLIRKPLVNGCHFRNLSQELDMADVELLDDAIWKKIERVLPVPAPRNRLYAGRKPVDPRKAISGIVYVLKRDIPWEDLPQDLGFGSGMTCWRRLRLLQEQGVWDKVAALLHKHLPAKAGIDMARAKAPKKTYNVKPKAAKTAVKASKSATKAANKSKVKIDKVARPSKVQAAKVVRAAKKAAGRPVAVVAAPEPTKAPSKAKVVAKAPAKVVAPVKSAAKPAAKVAVKDSTAAKAKAKAKAR